MDVFTVRLMPGDDLQKCLVKFIQDKGLSNGFIITCVGSLTKAVIRMANANVFKTYEGKFDANLQVDGVNFTVVVKSKRPLFFIQ